MLPTGDTDVINNVINKLSLLHLVDCLYYSINDARSHKHQEQSSFRQQIGLKFKEDTCKVLLLERSFLWC